MDTIRTISTRRRIAVTLISLLVATASAGSIRDDGDDIDEHERDELAEGLEGIAGRDRQLVNPPGTIEAAFLRESYRPGQTATLELFTHVRRLTIRVFRSGPERIVTRRSDMMFGVEVGPKRALRSVRRGTTIRIRVGDWPSGLYFVRLASPSTQLGFAPFVVAPRRLGEHRIAVVMPTNTWFAYNVRDDDRDGVGESWYADPTHKTIVTSRPDRSPRRTARAFAEWSGRRRPKASIQKLARAGRCGTSRRMRRLVAVLVLVVGCSESSGAPAPGVGGAAGSGGSAGGAGMQGVGTLVDLPSC